MKKNLRIGEILEEKGYVTGEQMSQALAYQKEHREMRVGQILMELGFVTENQVLEALANRLNLEIVEVSQIQVNLQAVGMISRELAEKNLFLPVSLKGKVLGLVTNDPLNYFALEEVKQQTGCQLEIYLSEEVPLRKAISYYYAEVNARNAAEQANVGFATTEELEIEDLDASNDEAPIIRLLNSLIERAIKTEASDIHIEPFEKETKVRMRIDGVIMEYVTIQRNIHAPLIARIKILSNLDIAEKRIPQDGHFRVKINDSFVNIRVSVLPTVFGEKAVLRIMAATGHMEHADHFGMDDFSYNQFFPMLNYPNGIIYITGPTGSGKSTTLAAMIEHMNQVSDRHIITIEDPVEYVYENKKSLIHQREVGEDVESFAAALRSALREDPDVILVGEMRDYETIQAALLAAETGHLVLSTLHTTGATQTVERIIDACPTSGQNQVRIQLAGTLKGIISQCLIPCEGGMARVAATELLTGTDAILNLVREGVSCRSAEMQRCIP